MSFIQCGKEAEYFPSEEQVEDYLIVRRTHLKFKGVSKCKQDHLNISLERMIFSGDNKPNFIELRREGDNIEVVINGNGIPKPEDTENVYTLDQSRQIKELKIGWKGQNLCLIPLYE